MSESLEPLVKKERSELSDLDIDEFIEADSETLLNEQGIDVNELQFGKKREYEDDMPVSQKRWLTFTYCFAYCSLGLGVAALGPSMKSLASVTGIALDQEERWGGILFFGRGVGWILGSLIAGQLYEKYRGNRLLWISLLITVVTSVVIPFMPNPWLLLAITVFQGSFMSWVEVGVNTLILWVWKDNVAPYMQLLHFAYGIGLSVFPFIAGLGSSLVNQCSTELPPVTEELRSIGHWQLSQANQTEVPCDQHMQLQLMISYWTMSLIVLISAFFPLKFKSPPIDKDAENTAHVVSAKQTKKIEEDPQQPSSTATSLKKKQRVRYYIIIVLTTAFLLLYGGAENTFGGWIAPYAKKSYDMSEDQADYMDAVFWAALTTGRLVAVPLATRLSTRIMLIIDLSGCLLTTILWIAFARFKSQILLWGCTILLGLSMASMFGSAFTIPAELKVKVSGKAASAFIIASGIGDMAFPSAVGFLLDLLGQSAFPWTLLGSFAVCILLDMVIYVYGLSTMEKKLDEVELQELSELDEHWSFQLS